MRIIFASLLLFPSWAQAYELKGKVFEKGTDRTHLLFDWQRTEKKDGPATLIKGVFTAPDKSIAVVDEALVKDGKLLKYTIHQHQLGQEGELLVQDGKLRFSYTKDGKTETNTEDLPENFAAAPVLTATLAQHRDVLLKGDTLKLRYAVLDRKETIGFSFFKVEEKKVGGVEAVVIKMKPSSFLVAAVVDPVFLTLRKDDFRSLEVLGRTLPKRRVDEHWKDLDGDTVYF